VLWDIVLRYVRAQHFKSAGSLGGEKTAFKGSYSRDLPQSLLEDGLLESLTPEGEESDQQEPWLPFLTAESDFKYPTAAQNDEVSWLNSARSHQEESQIPEDRCQIIEKELARTGLFSQDRTWVL
jgi:hypothetical protein